MNYAKKTEIGSLSQLAAVIEDASRLAEVIGDADEAAEFRIMRVPKGGVGKGCSVSIPADMVDDILLTIRNRLSTQINDLSQLASLSVAKLF